MTIDEVQYLDWQWVEENPQTALCLMLELHRDNAALRQDKERLDWLEETLISLYATPTPDMRGARIRGQLRNKRRDDSGAAGPSYIRLFHASIRAAIDAARKYEGQK